MNYQVAAVIAANGADEWEAIEGYYKLLEMITDPEDADVIKEIISDEKNHKMLLTKMAMKYDSNIEVAED